MLLGLAQLDVLRNWKETEAYKNDVHLLPTARSIVVKLGLSALGTMLTVFGEIEETRLVEGIGRCQESQKSVFPDFLDFSRS